MNIIKTILVSCTLMYSCALLSSAAASQPAAAQVDEFECCEVPLVPMEAAQEWFDYAKQDLQTLETVQHKDFLHKVHQASCATTQLWAHATNTIKHISTLRQQEGNAENIDAIERELVKIKATTNDENKKYSDFVSEGKEDHSKTSTLFLLTERQRNFCFAQAIKLRAENEVLLKKLAQKDSQNQRLTTQNQRLKLALQQSQPGSLEMEGLSLESSSSSNASSQQNNGGKK